MPIKYLNRNNNSTAISAGNSVLFNGSSQYLSIANNAAFDLTGDFTIECWVYAYSFGSYNGVVGRWPNAEGNVANSFVLEAVGGDLEFFFSVGSTLYGPIQGAALTLNIWQHVAAVRSGNTMYIFVNGVMYGSGTSVTQTFNNVASSLTVGGNIAGAGMWDGFISNLRILKGTALYTSNFTPSTSPLTAIANTSLLTCNAATIIDGSSNNFTITNNGAATVSSITPFTVVTATSVMKFTNRFNAETVSAGTQKAIFGYGYVSSDPGVSITNLVSNTGVVSSDTTGVGTGRSYIAASSYGGDKAIFGYGQTNNTTQVSITNLVSNTGVVATDTAGVGTARSTAAAGYGSDKAVFGYGYATVAVSITNLVSNTGVVANDTTGVGTARWALAAASYGTDKAVFGYGYNGSSNFSITNLVSNTGVVSNDITGVGTIRRSGAAAGYGTDKAIFGYGYTSGVVSMTNLVSNTGVVATDTTGVGTARAGLAAAGYGSDKAIFGYGLTSVNVSMTNLVSNTGVVATDTTGVGTARYALAAAGFSSGTIPAPSVMKFANRFTDAVASIVTSGLVLNLDASNASSYPGSGTSWFDLSGNGNNGTLTNGPTFNSANGGSIVFDGSNDYATLGASIPTNLRLGQGNFTIDFWVYPNGTGTYSICGNLNDADGGGSYWVIINSTYTGLHTVQFGYAGGAGYKFGTTALPINVWSNVILSRIGTTMTCYINGSSYATPITVNNFTGNFNIDYLIGMSKSGGGFTSYPLNGRLSILRIYNGVGFTQSEVLQNYNANRARFGL